MFFFSLWKLLAHIPGVKYNPHGLGRIYIPVPSLGPAYLALEYEKKCVDLKLYFTNDSNKHLYLGILGTQKGLIIHLIV